MNQLAVVTGSSRGIGKAVALSLAHIGYNLLLLSRPSDALEQTAEELRRVTGREINVAYADLLDEEAIVHAVCDKDVSILVNCGIYQGPGESARIDLLESEELRKLFQGNVLSQFALVKAVLPRMLQRGSGAIFQLVSSSSRVQPTRAVDKGGFQAFGYVATKAAVAKLIPILAVEHAENHSLRFFNIDPGLVITDKMRLQNTANRFERWGPTPPEATGEVIAYLSKLEPGPLLKTLSGAEFIEVPVIHAQIKSRGKI